MIDRAADSARLLSPGGENCQESVGAGAHAARTAAAARRHGHFCARAHDHNCAAREAFSL